MTGQAGAHTNRPELVAVHGYDTKYAMHALRLGLQGVELLTTGRITLPVPEPHRAYLRSVRRGERELAEVLDAITETEKRLAQLKRRSPTQQPRDASRPAEAMPSTQVARGEREGRARTGTRRPRAGRDVIAEDFAFRGNSAANTLRNFRDHGPRPTVPVGQTGRNGHALGQRRFHHRAATARPQWAPPMNDAGYFEPPGGQCH
jgi:hypothetical protein